MSPEHKRGMLTSMFGGRRNMSREHKSGMLTSMFGRKRNMSPEHKRGTLTSMFPLKLADRKNIRLYAKVGHNEIVYQQHRKS